MNSQRDVMKLLSAGSSDSLPPDPMIHEGRRLAFTAAAAALVHLAYTVLYRTVWADVANPIGFLAGLVGFGISAATAAYLFSARRTAAQAAGVGVVYEVLLAMSLNVSDSWALSYDAPSAQVSWSAVVIVLFPLLIPARPAWVLGGSVLAAATTPLSMAVVFAAAGRDWPPLNISLSFVLPPLFCALLAWAPTSVIAQLSRELRQAKRLGSYELTAKLGSGGMGEVWRARHRLLARPAAVKLIKPEVLGAKDSRSQSTLLRRFEREAQVTASLESPHTVELYDFGVSDRGELFYVMELLQGVDLESLVERFGALPSERVVHLLSQACDSLQDAHARGLIHRDIKPANLFVARKGGSVDFLKVLDFGLVKAWSRSTEEELAGSLQASTAPVSQTAIGQIIGTPSFLAPEAALGADAVDHRADLYSLGCVGYWMLTGKLVFAETTVMGMAVAHVTRAPEPPSTRTELPIAPELEALIMSCLQKDRALRPASADALREALGNVALESPWSRERARDWWGRCLPEA